MNVLDLLTDANIDGVCDFMRQMLKIADEERDGFREYYGRCIEELMKVKPVESDQVICLTQRAWDDHIIAVPISHKVLLDDTSDEDLLQAEIEFNQQWLTLAWWESALGSQVKWLMVSPMTAKLVDQSVAIILLDMFFMGAEPDIRIIWLETLRRRIMIHKYDSAEEIRVQRISPWYMPGAAVDVHAIINRISTDPHYTLYGVYADIWGVPRWTVTDYRILAYILSEPYGMNDGQLESFVAVSQITQDCHCTKEDILCCLHAIEDRYVWINDMGKPHRARLICDHRIIEDVLTIKLDRSLLELYKQFRAHLSITKSALAFSIHQYGDQKEDFYRLALTEVSMTYLDGMEGTEIPQVVLVRNLPVWFIHKKESQEMW